ncbi:MAG: hypothetical protein A2X36_09355 [Elusimicrobia bacterium GWA2_69_24]|nr:MAG: hypothetical protein A2X36_09355 [Elusimicrobia bacterium GWA2_69_24]HBL15964.1 hypothetical protein [Elusimicrobiota bacterium]
MADADPGAYARNLELSGREFSEGRVLLESNPVELLAILTTGCGMRCVMCSRWREAGTLPEAVAFKLAGLFPTLRFIDWQGGEVFLLPYARKLLEAAGAFPNVDQSVTTSGIPIDAGWARALLGARVSLNVSIDAAEPGLYERIRQGAAFADLCRALDHVNAARAASANRIRLTLLAVVMRSNHRELDPILEFAREHDFDSVQYLPVKGVTDAENIFLHRNPEALAYLRDALPVLAEKAARYRIELRWFLPFTLSKDSGLPAAAGVPGGRFACRRPWERLVVDASRGGGLYPDCGCRTSVGNLYTDSWRDAWNSPAMQDYRRGILRNEVRGICSSDCVSGVVVPGLIG